MKILKDRAIIIEVKPSDHRAVGSNLEVVRPLVMIIGERNKILRAKRAKIFSYCYGTDNFATNVCLMNVGLHSYIDFTIYNYHALSLQ